MPKQFNKSLLKKAKYKDRSKKKDLKLTFLKKKLFRQRPQAAKRDYCLLFLKREKRKILVLLRVKILKKVLKVLKYPKVR